MIGGIPWVTEWDLMLGVDAHNELCVPPTPPLPSEMHRHLVGATMRWVANSSEFGPPTVFVENRAPCKHYHDISYFIPHIPVPLPGWVLLPVIIPLSSSKLIIGSFVVHSANERVGLWGLTNNCCSNFPRPSGFITPTRLPTVFVGVSFLDIWLSIWWAGVDMVISYLINKLFDKLTKKWLSKVLTKVLGKALGKYAEVELVAAINQIVVKMASDVAKKYAGKYGKEGVKFLAATVKDWFARTNPGMQEKYIVIFEAEAPHKLAAYLHESLLPQVEQASLEALQRDFPEIHALLLQDPLPSVSLEELEQAIQQALGPMIKDATRGLLSGNEWEKLLSAHDATPEGQPLRP